MLQKMIKLYLEEGLSLADVGKRMGISRQAVHQRLHRAGLTLRRNAPHAGEKLRAVRAEIDLSELLRQYVEEKKSLMELARVFGVNSQMLGNILRGEGVEIRPNISYASHKYPQIYALNPGESVIMEFPPIVSVYASVGTIARRMKARLSAHRLGKLTYKISRLS